MAKIIGIVGAILALIMLSTVCIAQPPVNGPIANDNTFNFNINNHVGNVLNNDQGKGIKVVEVGKTINYGVVIMQSDGDFCFVPGYCSIPGGTTHDKFTYVIKDKNGLSSTATVYINFKFNNQALVNLDNVLPS